MTAIKRGKRTTVAALYEALVLDPPSMDDGVQTVLKMAPSKSVVRLAIAKFKAASRKDIAATLMRVADKLGYTFRGTTYVVGKNKRLIIPVDGVFEVGTKVIVDRDDGMISIHTA